MTDHRKQHIPLALFIAFLVGWASLIQAAVPGQVSYQGMITDNLGIPLEGTHSMRFYLYDAGGTQVWYEEHLDVVVTGGVYNIQLGAVLPLSVDFFADGEVYLGVAVYHADSSTWEMLSPRQPLTSTPYAFQAENADTLAGQAAADFAPSVHAHSGGDITTGTVDEARIDPDIARDVELSWGNLTGIPSDIADGDQVGVSTETDPTITDPSIKDGVSWDEVSGIPSGFADNVDDIGLSASSDYGRSGVSSTLYEGATALTDKYVGKSGSQAMANGSLTVTTTYGLGNAAVTGVKGFAQSDTYGFGVLGEATGSQGYGVYGDASGTTGRGVYGAASSTGTGVNYGGYFTAAGTLGQGVYGEATNTGVTTNVGGHFVAKSSTGRGVVGQGSSAGGEFYADGASGYGVYGEASNTGDVENYGGYFTASGSFGRGVYGEGTTYGGYFLASDSGGVGIVGDGDAIGGWFLASNSSGTAVWGNASGSTGSGVTGFATGTSGRGIGGWAMNSGAFTNYGGHFAAEGAYGQGVYGEAINSGDFTNHGGFFIANGTTGRGVYGEGAGASGRGVYGKASNTGNVTNYGGYFIAEGTYGYGVYGYGKSYDFYAAGPGTNYGYASSIRWKQNIEEINSALDMVMQMRGVYFDWDLEHGGHHDIGFIAEEVGRRVPEVVVFEEDSDYASGMDYGKMTPILLQAIKEQQGIISELRIEIETLKEEIQSIKAGR